MPDIGKCKIHVERTWTPRIQNDHYLEYLQYWDYIPGVVGEKQLTRCYSLALDHSEERYESRLHNDKVVLLTCGTSKEGAMFLIEGFVTVENLSYQKMVRIRYSIDNWMSFEEQNATYEKSLNGTKDVFAFRIRISQENLNVCDRITFAVHYEVDGKVFWDNNQGGNYMIFVIPQ